MILFGVLAKQDIKLFCLIIMRNCSNNLEEYKNYSKGTAWIVTRLK